PAFGNGGVAIRDFAPVHVDANDSVSLANGNTITVGTHFTTTSPRTIVMTAHNQFGHLDNGFGSGGIVQAMPADHLYAEGHAATIDPRRRLPVAGLSAYVNAFQSSRVIVGRFHTDGTPDESFGVDGYGHLPLGVGGGGSFRPSDIDVAPLGRIVVVGSNSTSFTA